MTDAGNESRVRAEALGAFLKSLRIGLGMSLRDVEDATSREVSNPYLSQIEHGRIIKPSPHILHSLADVYGTSYADLMERAGYVAPNRKPGDKKKHGRAATFAAANLTEDEETELLKYLAWYRSTRHGKA